MEKFKNYLLALLFSVLGGITAITGYEYFNDDKQTISVNYDDNIKFANYVLDTADIIIPEGLNFIYTSKKTTPAVVHIRTTYEGRTSSMRNPFEDMFRDFFGEKVYKTKIPRNVRISEAPSHGKPVLIYDTSCVGSKAYIELAKELILKQ